MLSIQQIVINHQNNSKKGENQLKLIANMDKILRVKRIKISNQAIKKGKTLIIFMEKTQNLRFRIIFKINK